jgi:hypothetical protein
MAEMWGESWVTPLSAVWSNADQMQWSFSHRRAAMFLKKHASDRRLRLFTVAVCRSLRLETNRRVLKAIEAAERFADDESLDDQWADFAGHSKNKSGRRDEINASTIPIRRSNLLSPWMECCPFR